jgi:hypothetical protein
MWRLKLCGKTKKRESGQAAAKKRKKKAREEHTSLSRRVQSAPLSLSKARLSREEGDELERALMVFFPGKKQPKQRHKEE